MDKENPFALEVKTLCYEVFVEQLVDEAGEKIQDSESSAHLAKK